MLLSYSTYPVPSQVDLVRVFSFSAQSFRGFVTADFANTGKVFFVFVCALLNQNIRVSRACCSFMKPRVLQILLIQSL